MQPALIKRQPSLSPLVEMGAYEALWLNEGATTKRLADRFRKSPGAVPSDFVDRGRALECATEVRAIFNRLQIDNWGVRVHGAGDYPKKLRDARNPVELLYYRGWWAVSEQRSVAIVGARKASDAGKQRAAQLARGLVAEGFVIVSGLARGIDTAAHTAAIKAGGRTIAVIGTPISRAYPSENARLQEILAKHMLVISQVPVLYHREAHHRVTRGFFPERNKTMSALTEATIIVEASETSGTLTQARAAFAQGRKLFILNSCFERADITWPRRFAEKGAIRVRTLDDILANL